MNASNNVRLSGASDQSGSFLTISRVGSLISASLLAVATLFSSGSVKATNVLVNPGAETGDFTGWSRSLTGYSFVVSTNSLINGAGTGNVLAHSGKNVFQLFDTTTDSSYIYQEYAAIAGSQWSASCYAICYSNNYFLIGAANAHMQVAFYDSSNNVVPYPSPASGGVLGSVFLDPEDLSGFGITYAIVPPMAVDATGWLYLPATNLYDADPATEASYDPATNPVPATLTAPPGTAYVRYQLEYDNTLPSIGAVFWDDCDLEKLNWTDPDITNQPVSVTAFAGAAASFSVTATHTGAYPNEKFTYQWQFNGTNLPPGGGVNNISGTTTTPVLTFTNVQGADSGLYSVLVTLKSVAGNYTNSITSVPVPLTVFTLSPLQKANALGVNSGFESNPVWIPWNVFNGCYFATAANTYDGTTPVNVLDGGSVCLLGANGDRDNGFYQVIPAPPGSVWKAGGWAYISSLNDIAAGNTCRLQIWFKDNSGTTVPATPNYESFKLYGLAYTNADMQYVNIDTSSPNYGQVGYQVQLPRDQWVYLAVTNEVNIPPNATSSGFYIDYDLPTNTLPTGDFVVPTNAAQINLQVYEYCPINTDTNLLGQPPEYLGSASGGVYWDDMELIQVLPVTNLTARVTGGTVNLSFSAGAGIDYAILYKTNLTDAHWNVLSNNITAPLSWQTNITVMTTTYPLTVSDPVTLQGRFYRVQSQ
jgi:hypothetical protein